MPYGSLGKSSKPTRSLFKRALIVVGVVVLFGSVFLWWRIDRAINEMLEPVRWFADVRHDGTFFRFNGDFGIKQLTITPHADKAGNQVHVDRLTIHTPGLFWLLGAAFGDVEPKPKGLRARLAAAAANQGDGGGIPPADRLGVTFENLSLAGAAFTPDRPGAIGYPSGAPFEALACGDLTRFTRRELTAMGLPDNPTRLTFRYEVLATNQVLVSARVHTEGVASGEIRAKLRVDDAERFLEADFERASTIELQYQVRDEGFVGARNRFCSQRTRQSRENYPDRHIEALRRVLLADGAVPGTVLERTYRRYLSRGDVLTLAARPNTSIAFEQFHHFKPEDRVRLLNAALVVGDAKAVPLAFTFTTPVPLEDKRQLTLEEQIEAEIEAERAARAALQRGEVPVTSGGPSAGQGTTGGAAAAVAGATPAASPGAGAVAVATPTPTSAASPGATPAVAASPTPTPAGSPSGSAAVAAVTPGPGPRPTPQATPTPAVTPTPSPSPPPVALALAGRSGVVAYADLKKHLGRRIRVETTLNSVRTGVLIKHTDTAMTMRLLDGRERGLELTLPRQTVKETSLVEGLLDTLPAPTPTPPKTNAAL